MTTVNPNDGNETRSDIIPWDIFKSGAIAYLIKKTLVFQRFSKSSFLSFMTKVKPDNGNGNNETFFHGTYSNLTSLFIGLKCRIEFSDTLCSYCQSRKVITET